MMKHVDGGKIPGKSQFLFNVDADKAVLDAAAYADKYNLWDVNGKARVPVVNGAVGIYGRTGELTEYINVYRTKTNWIHGTPASPQK